MGGLKIEGPLCNKHAALDPPLRLYLKLKDNLGLSARLYHKLLTREVITKVKGEERRT